MIAVGFGGGTNSTGLLVGLHERGIRPDVILFADTGNGDSEKPHTYDNVRIVSEWCQSVGFPAIETVRVTGETLLANCLRRKALPSAVYGLKTCSQRWKIEPQDKYLNSHPQAKQVWTGGGRVTKFIGFDADEPQRAKPFSNKKYNVEYPLIEWNWGRDECVDAIARAGLPQPGKSACYFCPNSSPAEVGLLREQYPDLYIQALELEENAELTTLNGLGRNWSWRSFDKQERMWDYAPQKPCGCYE